MKRKHLTWSLLSTAIAIGLALLVARVPAQQAAAQPAAKQAEPAKAEAAKKEALKPDPAWKRISETDAVWIDEKNRQVIVGGEVTLRKGLLEMFACLEGTKEHESVVAADTKAYIVHAALLAIGAETGTPVVFTPEYKPATGTPIDILLKWRDDQGKIHEAKAESWVRSMKTKKPLEQTWVFAGSGFWEDETTGKKHYMAEGGDFICVSNFPSAMLDLPIESSQGNEDLLFEAFTENIPDLGTPVLMYLKPRLKEKPAAKEPKAIPTRG